MLKKFKNKIEETFKKLKNKIKEISNNLTPILRTKLTTIISNAIPDKDLQKTTIIFWFISAFTIIAIIWGSIARVDMVVRATGSVIPESKIQLVQSVAGGVIEEINAELGDTVKKGDILFIIDGKVAEAEYNSNEQFYQSTILEVETREKKVSLIEDLVEQGAAAEMTLLDEKLMLVDAQRRLSQASSKREALKQTMNQSIVKSPVDGTVSAVDVTTIGQVLQPGQILANIVPKDIRLVIEAFIQTQDISFVHEGQNAKITFSAFDPGVYGTFDGKVIEVAASSRKLSENDPLVFAALIEVNDEDTNQINIQSGMTVDASIIGQRRTVIGYILNPVTKVTRQAFREK